MVYTGKRKHRPVILKLSEEIFHGACQDVELAVSMIYNGNADGDIISQYVSFTEQVDYFYQKYGRTKEAAEKLIEYCIQHSILEEYLQSRREEIMSMSDVIFDYSIHERNIREKALKRGTMLGEAQGERRSKVKAAVNMVKFGMKEEEIAQVLEAEISQVRRWLKLGNAAVK